MDINSLTNKLQSLPSEQHFLLLKAAIGNQQVAISAWEKWSSKVDYENTDSGSYRMYPMVYHHLKKLDVPITPMLERFKGVQKYHWSKSQQLLYKASEPIKALITAKIPVMLLKGAVLALEYYDSVGLRPFNDVDIMIPPEKKEAAIAILHQYGFYPKGQFSEFHFTSRHALCFENKDGLEIDLHLFLIPQNLTLLAQQTYWKNAIPINFKGLNIWTLCPTDHFFHTIIHGIRYNEVTPFRWIVDANQILKKQAIDWKRLINISLENQLSVTVLVALKYLKTHFLPSIPNVVLDSLASSINNYHFQEKELLVNTKKLRGLNHRLKFHWLRYLRINPNVTPNPIGFFNYLKYAWGLPSYTALPIHILKNSWRIIKN